MPVLRSHSNPQSDTLLAIDEKPAPHNEFRPHTLSQSVGLVDRPSTEAESIRQEVERSTNDLKQLIEQSARATREAQGAARLKSDFLATVSREIRTPLHAIIDMTAVLLARQLASADRDCVEIIRSSGEALLAIVDDVLDLSKIQAGRLQLDEADFQPAQQSLPAPHIRAPEPLAEDDAPLDFRILLVEDNPLNQKVALSMLAKFGYKADVAQHGKDALASVLRGHYDLILMDCLMPEMDGFEATRRIRASHGHGAYVPIIAMTASAFSKDREACLTAGMTDYLSNPVREHEIRDKLHHWLSLPQQ